MRRKIYYFSIETENINSYWLDIVLNCVIVEANVHLMKYECKIGVLV